MRLDFAEVQPTCATQVYFRKFCEYYGKRVELSCSNIKIPSVVGRSLTLFFGRIFATFNVAFHQSSGFNASGCT